MQERQFPPLDFEELTHAERGAVRRARARRARWLTASLGASVLALFALGCPQPGDLENPGIYTPPPKGGAASTAGSGTGGGAPAGCETACVNQIFQKDQQPCLVCHSTLSHLGDLDLESPGYTARLKDVNAKHTGITGSTAECPTGDKLIDVTTPANSWLLKKLHGEQKTCGTAMPQGFTISAEQKTCLETYVACVAPGGGATPTAGTGSGGSASGGGGGGGTGGT